MAHARTPQTDRAREEATTAMAALRLSSTAFAHDEDLPARYTADGQDVSPPLSWDGVPDGTRELVLICDDPDAEAGLLTLWVVYGIPPDAKGLDEAVPGDTVIDEPVPLLQGLNEFDESGYRGPEVDVEEGPHRIFFRLFALDEELDLPPGVTRREVRQAAKDHIIASATLVGIS